MTTGAITHSIDLAQVVLYGFWIFFAGLIYYLHREDKREGYPLVPDGRGGRAVIEGFPGVPSPKTYLKRDGSTRQSPPGGGADTQKLQAERTHEYPGSPLQPLGNPMLAGVGPGAYAQRPDIPDPSLDGTPRIVPMRAAPGFEVSHQDTDPRGLPAVGADGAVGGKVVDLWVDRSEMLFRYLELELPAGTRVLLPMNFADVRQREVRVSAVMGSQFADVPATRHPEQITMLEEERVTAYYGAGTLYAEPSRAEPLL